MFKELTRKIDSVSPVGVLGSHVYLILSVEFFEFSQLYVIDKTHYRMHYKMPVPVGKSRRIQNNLQMKLFFILALFSEVVSLSIADFPM